MPAASDELLSRWRSFLTALRTGDDEIALAGLQAWITEWDRCFWDADFSAFGEIYAQGFRGHNRSLMPGLVEIEGPEGFLAVRREAADAASRFWFDIQEFARGDEGAFAGLGRMRARGRYTGLVLQAPWAVVWRLEGDRLVEATTFSSHRKARAALDGRE